MNIPDLVVIESVSIILETFYCLMSIDSEKEILRKKENHSLNEYTRLGFIILLRLFIGNYG